MGHETPETIALKLLQKGENKENIADITGLSIADIDRILESTIG